MSWSRIKQGLSAEDTRRLVQWFEESYTDGWRPPLYVEETWRDMYDKIGNLREANELPGSF